MTYEEATEVGEEIIAFYDLVDTEEEAMEILLEATEKQIPKKSVEIITDDNEYPYDRCPSCKRKLYIGQPYCDNCGRAIDWSE